MSRTQSPLTRPGTDSGSLLGGIDIGGTKIAVCVGTPEGRVIASERMDVDRAAAPEELLARAQAALTRLAGDRLLAAVGCSCPGPLDYKAGRFINPPNNPRWHGFGLRDWLNSNFPCPSTMMNDANAAALAEHLWGASRDTSTSVFLTMSTGMGAGLIIDGHLYEGPLGLAGEIGRLAMRDTDDGPVGFGRRGTAEGYCSGPGMSQLAESEAIISMHSNEMSQLLALYLEHGSISPEQLCQAAMKGDAAAIRVTNRVATELGRLMAVMTLVLNPEMFVLGTIGTAYPELFIPIADTALAQYTFPAISEIVTIRPSGLPDRASSQAMAVAAKLLISPPH